MANSVEGYNFIMYLEKINYMKKKQNKVKNSLHAHITLIETTYEQMIKTQKKIILTKKLQRFYRQFSLRLAGETLIVS